MKGAQESLEVFIAYKLQQPGKCLSRTNEALLKAKAPMCVVHSVQALELFQNFPLKHLWAVVIEWGFCTRGHA